MTRYLVQRILVSVPVFLGVTVLVFAMYALSPGDPVVAILGTENMERLSPEQIQQVRVQ